ncbi:MAG: ATP-binding cassette domain-containing protein [Alphaproteobacteria bacterium]|nr:ATP-binding cassette domain-containing protein [Alphaproteobacteria bacterium]
MSLVVNDLAVRVGSKRLVEGISFTATAERPLTILGETGAGKSLIAQAIMGALPTGLISSGEVHLDEKRIDILPRRDREALWGRKISMLPQEPWRALDPLMRNAVQVAETHVELSGRSWTDALSRARESLSALGLRAPAMAGRPGTLSGGMAQRVAFSAASAAGAGVLLADEPTKGLDPALCQDVVGLLKGFVDAGGILVTITHDVSVAMALGGDAIILRAGEIVESGPVDRVLGAPQSAYGRELVSADPSNWPDFPTAVDSVRAESVLSAENLSIARAGRTLVQGLTFSMQAGARVAVSGPSGLGKTTLVDTLAGLIPPSQGRVSRLGRAQSRFAIQKLYQDPPAAFPPHVPLHLGFEDLERRHAIPAGRIANLIERLGLTLDMLQRRPAEVSGGELQRLALARVLALRPAAILADEPTSRLDPVTQRAVMEMITEVAAETETAILLVTHNVLIANHWADRTIHLEQYATSVDQAA